MQVYIGIDWSHNKHDLCYLNQAGARLAQMTIPHTMDGFRRIDEIRERLGIPIEDCQIGLETPHNLLVDFLWDQARYSCCIRKWSRTRAVVFDRAQPGMIPAMHC